MTQRLSLTRSLIAVGVALGAWTGGAGAIESAGDSPAAPAAERAGIQIGQFTVLPTAQPSSGNQAPQAESQDTGPDSIEAPEASTEPTLPEPAEAPAANDEPLSPPVEETQPVPTQQVERPADVTFPETATPSAVYEFEAARSGNGAISMSGSVPAEATREFLTVISTGADVAALAIAPGAPEGFVPSVVAGIRALARLSDGRLALENGRWSLSGTAPNAEARAAAEAEIAALPEAAAWMISIGEPSPRQVCAAQLAEFSSANYILFQSGSATIAESSLPALDVVAATLVQCPEASVNIEGHTDADGDARSNLALSVARAEAVVEALIARGVGSERLYAVGYGETAPIASNETAEGKRLNRRIVFTLLEDNAGNG